jgi:hypothetical protein
MSVTVAPLVVRYYSPIDIVRGNGLFFIQKGREANAGILYEVSDQEGNEKCQERNHEERKASNSRYMPSVRD